MLQKIAPFFLILTLLAPFSSDAATKKGLVLCVNQAGDLSVKLKCKKGETVYSPQMVTTQVVQSAQLQGPKGTQGMAGPIGPGGDVGVQGAAGLPGEAGSQGGQGGPGPQGAQGPAGLQGPLGLIGVKGSPGIIDFSGCRKVSSGTAVNLDGSFMVIPAATATAVCNPSTEFVFSDGYTQASLGGAGTKAFIRSRVAETNTIAGDTREYQVTYTAERIYSAGQGQYSFQVEVLCCPR